MECLPQIVWGCRFFFAWFSGWRTVKWSIMTIVFNVHWIKTDIFVESQTKFATTLSQARTCPQGILVTHAFRIYIKMHSSCVWSVLLQLWQFCFWFSLICHLTPKDVPMKRWSSFFQATLRHFLDLFQTVAVSEGFPSKSSDSVKRSDDVSWCVLRSLPVWRSENTLIPILWVSLVVSWAQVPCKKIINDAPMPENLTASDATKRQTQQIRNWVNERLSKLCVFGQNISEREKKKKGANDLFRCRIGPFDPFWGISAPTPQAFLRGNSALFSSGIPKYSVQIVQAAVPICGTRGWTPWFGETQSGRGLRVT